MVESYDFTGRKYANRPDNGPYFQREFKVGNWLRVLVGEAKPPTREYSYKVSDYIACRQEMVEKRMLRKPRKRTWVDHVLWYFRRKKFGVAK